jgi:hypothetical protein
MPPPQRKQYGQENNYGESVNKTINCAHAATYLIAPRVLTTSKRQLLRLR